MADNTEFSCIVCMETIPSTDRYLLTWCFHKWCKDCVNIRFAAACQEEGSFPPRCCEEIDYIQARPLLEDQLAALFIEKAREYRSIDRLYCHDVQCQNLIQVSRTSHKSIHCEKCGLDTCTGCMRKAHENECSENPEYAGFLQVVTQAGFKQCFRCRGFIEKVSGCNHIVCQCRGEFCYQCGSKWKTCNCDEGDEGDEGEEYEEFDEIDELDIQARQREAQRMEGGLHLGQVRGVGTFHSALPTYHEAPPRPGNTVHHPVRQLSMEDTLYIPDSQPAQMAEPDHYQGQTLYQPQLPYPYFDTRGRLTSAQPAEEAQQLLLAAIHHRRPECVRGFRRVNHGSLACSVCEEIMAQSIWRCIGCRRQECDRCRDLQFR